MNDKQTTFFYNIKPINFISVLLILISSLGAVYYGHFLYNYSPVLYYIMFFILFQLIILWVYIKLYKWRKLSLSVSSFVFFALNVIQLTLYLSAISYLFSIWYYEKNIEPFYLENLSFSSQYRYLFLTIISFLFIFIYLLAFAFKLNILEYLSSLTFPYLKEEVRIFIDTWSFIGDVCNKMIDLLYFSSLFRSIYFIIHFSLFSVVRLLTTVLLFYCTFHHGDFRNFLYLTPIMFLVWLLSFFNYYFIIFQQGCENYIRSLISATLKNKNPTFFNIIKINPSSQVLFELTEEAVSKGYSVLDIDHLAKEWYIQAELSTFFDVYFKIVKYLNYFILLLQIIIWFYITQIFFFPLLKKYILSVSFVILCRSMGQVTVRPFATEVRRVLPPYQKKLAQETEGAHHGNHPVLIDPAVKHPDDPKKVLYEGQLTHGKGSTQNPTFTEQQLNGNTTLENKHSEDFDNPATPYVFFTKEAEQIDKILKGITISTIGFCEKANITVTQSKELADQWVPIIKKTDELIKENTERLTNFWQRKWLTYSTAGNFCYTLLSAKKEVLKDTVKESTKNSLDIASGLKLIAENPNIGLTSIFTGMGILSVTYLGLKFVRFITRK